MPTAKKFTREGSEQGTATLPAHAFEAEVNEHAIWEDVKRYMANQRQGNADVKGKGEVSGSGKKPWRQKGTGRARVGYTRNPIWYHGGSAFGPTPRDYSYAIPKKVKALALRSALTIRAREEKVWVIEDPTFDPPKTKSVATLLKNLGLGDRKVLLVTGERDPNLLRASRNLPRFRTLTAGSLNTYLVMDCDALLLTSGALGKLEAQETEGLTS
jgi:large subunit ribosomal protein L4